MNNADIMQINSGYCEKIADIVVDLQDKGKLIELRAAQINTGLQHDYLHQAAENRQYME